MSGGYFEMPSVYSLTHWVLEKSWKRVRNTGNFLEEIHYLTLEQNVLPYLTLGIFLPYLTLGLTFFPNMILMYILSTNDVK